MYEIEIFNNKTNETKFIFGVSIQDAFRREKNLNPIEWAVIHMDYVD